MAHLKIPDEDRPIDDDREIQARLEAGGIEYQKWTPTPPLEAGAPDDAVLAAYAGTHSEPNREYIEPQFKIFPPPAALRWG